MKVVDVVAALGLGLWVLVSACGTSPGRARLPDGSYRLECKHELSHCLKQIETICDDYGYDVVSAKEERTRAGPMDFSNETIRSEAHVRCRSSRALFTTSEPEPKPAPPPPVDSAPLPVHAPLPPLTATPAPPAPAAPSSAAPPASEPPPPAPPAASP